MPMRQPTLHRPGAVLLAALLTLAACGGPTAPPPPPPPPPASVTVTPATLNLVVGETGQLTATVSNATGGVNWTTNAAQVATVSQTGLVSAVGAGNATITASLVSQPSVQATAAVTVTNPPVSVEVLGITQNGQPVVLTDVRKTIRFAVNLTVPAGFNGVLRVRLGDVVAGQVNIVNGVPAAPPGSLGAAGTAPDAALRTAVDVAAPTHAIDVIDQSAIPRIPNGNYATVLELIQQGQTLTSANGPNITLNNRSAVAVLKGEYQGPTAVNPANNRTYGTGLDLVITTAAFDRATFQRLDEALIERIEVLNGPASSAVYGADAVAGVVNWIAKRDVAPAQGGLLDIGEGRFHLTKATITTSLGTFQADILNHDPAFQDELPGLEWNLDVRKPFAPPLSATFEPGSATAWINQTQLLADRLGEFGFTWTGSTPLVTDEGVGGVNCDIRFGTGATAFFPNPVTTGGDIGSETAQPSWVFRVQCWDALDNLNIIPVTNGVTTAFQQVGTDFKAPLVTFQNSRGAEQGIGEFAVNPPAGRAFLWSATDVGGAGLPGVDPYRIKLLRNFENATPADQCAVGNWMDPMCRGVTYGLDRYEPQGLGAGEYDFWVAATDRARNWSAYVYRPFVEDREPPIVSNPVAPATLAAGGTVTFGWDLVDNFKLTGSAFGIRYNNLPTVPIFDYVPQGQRFDGSFKRSLSLQLDYSFSASAERLHRPGSFWVPDGVERRATHALFGGVDAGNNVAYIGIDISSRVQPNFTSFRVGATGLDRVEFRPQPPIEVCANPYGAQGNCQGVPVTVPVNIDAYYPAGGTSRIQEMLLAKVSTVDGVETGLLLGGPMTYTRQNFGGFFRDTYTGQVRGDWFDRPGNYLLSAYGFDANRNILDLRNAAIPFEVKMAVRF